MSSILRRFQVSTTSTFVLEIGDTEVSGENPYIRFFVNAQQVELSGEPYEVQAPWASDDLLGLQTAQINDVMYFVHPDYPVHKLTRNSDTDWTLEEVVFDQPAFLDENLTDVTITPSGTSGNITLSTSGSLWTAGHIGSFWRIGHTREADTLSHPITGDGDSYDIEIFGPYTMRSYGTWTADLLFQRSLDSGTTWETVHKVVGESDQNLEIRGTAEVDARYRIRVENFVSATAARATIEREDAVIYGIVEITAVASDSSASATVLTDYPLYAATATSLWAEGAWSEARGYPRAICLHEQRLCFGGTTAQPSTVWGSALDDYENFERGTSDADSYAFTLAGLELNAIQWMSSLKALLVGTTGSEWRVIGDELGGIISPTKVSAKQFSFYGSEYVQAENTGEVVLFVERKGRRMREIRPDGDSFAVADLSLLAEHLTEDGYLRQLAWQKDARILWCISSDGRALGLTYNREQAVLGWHRHVTDGKFRSVATIYGDTGAEDEVWFIVERTVNSTQVFYVERLNPEAWTDVEDGFFVDSGLSYDGSPVSSVSGMDHLAGQTVDALLDGVAYTGLTVDSSGVVEFPSGVTASVVHVGLPYTSILSPFRLDADTQLGVHLGKSKRIDALVPRVRRSKGFSYSIGAGGAVRPAPVPEGTDSEALLGASDPLDIVLPIAAAGHTRDPQLTLQQSNPLPLTVLALGVGYSVAPGP